MQIEENKSLKELTTLKIGGTARYFVSVATVEALAEAVVFAQEKKVLFVILGGGSNVLVSDRGFEGLVIQINIKGIEWKEETPPSIPPLKRGEGKGGVLVVAGAGENWDAVVAQTVERGLWGLENLSGIPGTVGGAPIQNIGAYGADISETLQWLEIFDAEKGSTFKIPRLNLGLSYRDSIFKTPEGKQFIVTRVAFRLSKTGTPRIAYKDLQQIFNSQFSISNEDERKKKISELTPKDIRRAVLEIRSKKFPDLKEFGTAGSFFRNPIIPKERFDALKQKYPDLPGFDIRETDAKQNAKPTQKVKISLAWVLDNVCNLKGFQKGNVGLFERQPIVLVNFGNATAEEIQAFAREIAEKVKSATDIDIEWEVAFVGESHPASSAG